MRHFCIVHFNPIEKYPPVINLLRYISENPVRDLAVTVITTGQLSGADFSLPGIDIKRVIRWKKRNRIQRMLFYWQFNLRALRVLRRLRPGTVMYFETFSAGAPWYYKKWFDRECRLLIHYHEYTSSKEYANGIVLNRWFHRLEKSLYPSARWVSHTNEMRLKLFLEDEAANKPPHTFLLPNYPPASWHMRAKKIKRSDDERIGFVYVGSLSMETMYTETFARMVAGNPDFYWDIYSDNHDEEVLEFLGELGAPNIQFKGSVPYNDLPEILPQYDVGVILYNGHIPNFTYNAPNKFFEYLAAGLHVWYPGNMKGMHPYAGKDRLPKVASIDFDKWIFPSGDFHRAAELPAQAYQSEKVYQPLWALISQLN